MVSKINIIYYRIDTLTLRHKIFYSMSLIILFSVLQIGQVLKLFNLLHLPHIHICPQLQIKYLVD